MDWWAYVLIALVAYLLAAGVPWIVYVLVDRLSIHRQSYLQDEVVTRGRLKDALAAQRAKWPSIPRLGRYREPDQKALDRLADLMTNLSDADALWPQLEGYAGASFGLAAFALMGGWRAMSMALRTNKALRQVRQLLAEGEAHLDEIVVLEGMVADIPGAVIDLAGERARRVTALMTKITEEEQVGTTGLTSMRQQVAALQTEAEAAGRRLEAGGRASDEALLKADKELERIAQETGTFEQQLQEVADQRRAADALAKENETGSAALAKQWARLQELGARDPALTEALSTVRQQVASAREVVGARTPAAFAEGLSIGQEAQQRLAALQGKLDAYEEALQQAESGVSGDLAAVEDARQVVTSLGERALAVEAQASLEFIEKAGEAYRLAEEQLQAGHLEALQQSITASTQARELLQQALSAAGKSAELADKAALLLDAVSPERMEALRGRLEALRTELGEYQVIWRNGLSETAMTAGDVLGQAQRVLDQLPGGVIDGHQVQEADLEQVLESLGRVNELVTTAETHLAELDQAQARIARQRAELDTAVKAMGADELTAAQALAPQMLPERRKALDAFAQRFASETQTMLDPAQVDYDVAIGSWLPAMGEELQGLVTQHEQELRRLTRGLRDQRGRLDKNWRKLQGMLDKDPRRPAEDVDALFKRFGEWWDQGEGNVDKAEALHTLVEVQGPAIDEGIRTAIDQLEDGRRANRDLLRDIGKVQRDLERARELVARRSSDSGWPGLQWDVREADDLWRRVNEAVTKASSAPTIAGANEILMEGITLGDQALQAYQRERGVAEKTLAGIDAAYQQAARAYDAAVRQATTLREQGPSPELKVLEDRLDAARRDLDAAREATSVDEAEQRLKLAQEMLRPVSG